MEAIGRRQVMDAVIHILSANDRRDLTMREVSDLAGIPSGAITHYFSNKRALTLDAINDATLQFVKAPGKLESRRGDAPTTRRLVSQPSSSGIPEWRFWLTFFGRMPFYGVVQAELQKFQRRYAEVIVRPVEAGVDEGSFHPSRNPAISPLNSSVPLSGFVCRCWPIPPKQCRGVTLGASPSAEANTSAVN
jgi:AcrR family transcriptional regulator